MAKKKYYVVWKGRETGVFETWDDCKAQIDHFAGAVYKSFKSKDEATEAFNDSYKEYIGQSKEEMPLEIVDDFEDSFIEDSISVFSKWDETTLIGDYQAVYTNTQELIFEHLSIQDAKKELIEFLAIVHCLAHCKKYQIELPVYSNSDAAIQWVKLKSFDRKKALLSENKVTDDLLTRAISWLDQNEYDNELLIWNTHLWQENKAGF